KAAKKRDLPVVVVTFDPHPLKILSPKQQPGLLMTLPQKLSVFESLGAEAVWVIPFSREFSELEPDVFLDGLRKNLSPAELHVGQSFRFGLNRLGDVSALQAWGNILGYEIHTHAYKAPDGGIQSSSRIRQLLMDGDVALVSVLLGNPFTLTGVVVEGDRRGRCIGFPTANLAWEQEILPAPGVYVTAARCSAHLMGEVMGLTNVGVKPTFKGLNLTVETHLPEIDVNLYGSRLELSFLNRVRGEEKFESTESLQVRIAEDISIGANWWKFNIDSARP
ncbi:MAG: riboflavin biosynthesis protein RibF, partial [Holophagales bacterium]|nr:riboflavin biosynthesis protein RibF [Holophagales bacterium]